MATETLRPDAAGDETSLENFYPGDGAHWEEVDEAVADDGTTHVSLSEVGAYQRDLYNLPASGVGAGTINSITVHFRCAYSWQGSAGHAKASIKSNSTVTDGTEKNLTTSWANYSQQWNTNPADSQAWEWVDIDALQIGVSLEDGDGSLDSQAWCTQVYVVVDYTASQNYSESASVIIGTVPSATRAVAIDRDSSVIVGTAASASRVGGIVRAPSVIIGTVATATRGVGTFVRTASMSIGNLVSVSRVAAFTRVAVTPSTETLRPNVAGDETNLTPDGETNNWECIDEASPDDDTTDVKTYNATYLRDLYDLPASSGVGTINKITVYVRCHAYLGA